MFWRTPSRRSFGLLVLALTVACGTESPTAKPVATHNPKRSTTTTSTTTTTSPYAPATTTTSVLPLSASITAKQRNDIQYAWATVLAAEADYERATSVPDAKIVEQSAYFHGAAQSGYASHVAELESNGEVVTYPSGSTEVRFLGSRTESWGLTLLTCVKDGGIRRKTAGGAVVNDTVSHYFVEQQLVFIEGLWKLDGAAYIDSRNSECDDS